MLFKVNLPNFYIHLLNYLLVFHFIFLISIQFNFFLLKLLLTFYVLY